MTVRIHVLGPSCIDRTVVLKDSISLDGSSSIDNERYDAGGTGLCYSIALSRLGNSVTLHSRIGTDKGAEQIQKIVNSEKNIKAFWQVENGLTDHAYILIDKGNHKVVASIKDISNNWRTENNFGKEISTARAIVITTLLNKIADEVLNKVKKECRQKPFIMWAPHRENCYQINSLSQLKLVDHITLSAEEFNILSKQIGNPIKLGIKSITVTNGKNGCELITKDGLLHYDAYRVVENPFDTNGAGEAFGSGFLTVYLKNKNYGKAIRAGSYVGYLHVHRPASDFPSISHEKLTQVANIQENKIRYQRIPSYKWRSI